MRKIGCFTLSLAVPLLTACAAQGPKSTLHDEISSRFQQQIVAQFAEYGNLPENKVLVVCINWNNSSRETMNAQYAHAAYTAPNSDAQIFPTRLAADALNGCNQVREERRLDCDCAIIDKNGKPALQVPAWFADTHKPG